ncbi:EscV/YscV/HrcV family type III secretion system export apparatus protein [Arsenophonus nasoniae]|uniref:EscV/YscV/HrcV family type III secretion system export apparatus protein n=1 Tax=Arsenophonus nasoniae TaxID=638 RepID=D2TZ46_9GAMM|nr:EscV/YscV/HrcV family type III secretion system export apparatus protein [Arsenophonus nasoniae]QBY42332.1 Invasion protein InvA [Arsenophonus nasoniae]WGM02285.1 EscV/YscV/HrcV family type III secretion system export apparatus protein [Arsenophonus nasoniae]WGM06470.1 EscV/YscV/HrcV family type III secretion system export apparatus protein [Arsenophonus nasoniae]WGM11404.1 EscV/YscV/HrcV family type III secretion system export apparatus protein [Arsenophonus nasoniae]WGM16100.1 EscV/YscV/H
MNNFLNEIKRHSELFVLVLVFIIISMLVIPLPTYLVDFLIALNIILSALVFLSSFYVNRILNFSSFPAILLITTLFRLSLTVSTSRLILSEADAGEIVAVFGQFVIADNLVVGFVIFAIVTIVQFMVITKGSERVAEVAARFSLDGMPGKQMSIDADLRSSIIDAEEAKRRRSVVERESQLYGSFDGAMKFIKGDAIASIIIIFINFIGGISVGISQHHMDFSHALATYTILTVGDGLVAQIPALLIAIAAGFVVTRVNGDNENLGRTIINQLLTNPLILIISAIIALSIGSLPGFPFIVFLLISAILASIYYLQFKKNKPKKEDTTLITKNEITDLEIDNQGVINKKTNETIPLILVVNKSVIEKLKKENISAKLKNNFYLEYGINLPDIIISDSDNLEENTMLLLINEIKADQFYVRCDGYRLINKTDEIEHLGIEKMTINNDFWINETDYEKIKEIGYLCRHYIDEIYFNIANILTRYVHEYFGIQEAKQEIDNLEERYPDLIKEVVRHATIQRIAEILQRLINEKISIKNMKLIMETIAQWAPKEKDVILLVEHIRSALGRYICHKFSRGNNLNVILLSNENEEVIRGNIRNTSAGAFLNLEPKESEYLLDKISIALNSLPFSYNDFVILCSVDIRRFLKKFVENKFNNVDVISFGELTETVSVNVLRTI